MLNELFVLLAKDPNATNAIAAVTSAITAILAVLVSAIALYVSCVTLKNQQKHNVLSVRPIPIVTVADFEGSIRVKLRNNGSGPMIVKRIHVTNGENLKESLIEWMPDLPSDMLWDNFAEPVLGYSSLLPGGEIILLELSGERENQVFRQSRDAVRGALASLTVVIDYTDIYESIFQDYAKKLSWFARHQIVHE